MDDLNQTVDAQIRKLLEREVPGFDPAKVEYVESVLPPATGIQIVRIGSVRNLVFCVYRSGLKVLRVLGILATGWEAFVVGVNLFVAADLPTALQLAGLIRSEPARIVDNVTYSLSHQSYIVVKSEWQSREPTIDDLNRPSDPFYDDQVTLVNTTSIGPNFNNLRTLDYFGTGGSIGSESSSGV